MVYELKIKIKKKLRNQHEIINCSDDILKICVDSWFFISTF